MSVNNNNTSRSYEQALNLDVGILQLLLERNRLQHFRSAYFRRLEMVFRSIHKYNVIQDQDISEGLGQLITSIKNEHDRVASILERYKGIHKRRGKSGKAGNNIVEEEHWTISTPKAASAGGELEDLQSVFLRHVKELKITLTEHIPEILSRILYAAEALYIELSRGYFAPLCTVALASISRIRVLLLQLGRDGTLQLQRTLEWLKYEFCTLVTPGGELEETTGLYLHEVNHVLSHCVVKSWEDLMNSFIELDNDEHISAMANRRTEVILGRGSNISSRENASITNRTKDIDIPMGSFVQGTVSTDDRTRHNQSSPPDNNVDDEVGELVDSSGIMKTSDQETPSLNEKKDNGDRNLEMIAILKGKHSKRKRERIDTGPEEKNLQSKKAAKMEDNSSTVASIRSETKEDSDKSSERKKEKKTKKKKVKKKKKKSKDIIDDIFGDL